MKKYHPFSEKIVDILVRKVNNDNRHFFRILVGYYLSKVASMMRCNIQTKDRGVVPVNTYVVNLMVSGTGKGHSTNIMEREFVAPFKKEFLDSVFPVQAASHMNVLAGERAVVAVNSGQSPLSPSEQATIELDGLEKQFERLGELAFSFDSGTSPAVKQMREKLLLAGAGSMNFEVDEIGSNLTSNQEVLNTFLELYDVGLVKQKLTKNTNDNIRSAELPGATPTNLMMFGTPTKLLDGGSTEDEFKQFLETGYARRLLVGYSTDSGRTRQLTAKERYDQMVDTSLAADVAAIQQRFEAFAKRPFNPILQVSEANSIYLIEYQMACEDAAQGMKEHMSIHQAEMTHRYYKALKLAGAYAFADNSKEITKEHLDYAISVVEDSGECFHRMMKKQGAPERLANYLAACENEVTQHDLMEELPFFKGSSAQRRDILTLSMAYGHKHNISIRKRTVDDIDFYSGETLRETDMSALAVAISTDIAQGFVFPNKLPPFDMLHKLTTAEGRHYTAHSFVNGHRKNENANPGFDLLILDCDGDVNINTVKTLMEDYTYLISTTKRHTESQHRFRFIMPMSHRLNLSPDDYNAFMGNVFEWLPFPVDESARDIARKWESFPGQYFYNKGQLIDSTLFIPQTRRSEEAKAKLLDTQGVDNMERWFFAHTETGNRATHMYRYGMVLVDSGMALPEIVTKLETFNAALESPLPEAQFRNSLIKSISKEVVKRGN